MSFLKKLFGGGAPKAEPEGAALIHEGYTITPNVQKAEGGYRLAARIEREVGGEMKTHQLIRADVIPNRDECEQAAVNKAKQMIREQGDRLFG